MADVARDDAEELRRLAKLTERPTVAKRLNDLAAEVEIEAKGAAASNKAADLKNSGFSKTLPSKSAAGVAGRWNPGAANNAQDSSTPFPAAAKTTDDVRAEENARAQAVRDARKKKIAQAESSRAGDVKATPFAGARAAAAGTGTGGGNSRASAVNLEKFADLHEMTPDEQSDFFLLSFAVDLSGKSDTVLNTAEEFKAYLTAGTNSLDEVTAHKLLEEKGRAKTYQEMRDLLREIDQDCDGRVSLMEWLLFEFGKTIDELYATKVPPAMRDMMQQAIDLYRKTMAKKEGKLTEVQQLEALAAQGGIKGAQAKIKLAAIRQMGESGADIEEEVKADRNKKKAERLVLAHNKNTAVDEQKRVEEQRLKDEEERKRKRAEGKAKLNAIANQLQNKVVHGDNA